MKAWARAAGKLARYEHIGWSEWPHRRAWSFHSGAIAISGRRGGAGAAASGRRSWATLAGPGILRRALLGGEGAAEHITDDSGFRRAAGVPGAREPLGRDDAVSARSLRHHEPDVGPGDHVAEPIVVR